MRASAPTTPTASPFPHLVNPGRRDLRCRAMDRYLEKTSTLLTRLTHSLRKRPGRSPAPQTSPSATSRVGSLGRMLTYFILFS